jgi:hypothetical protein
MPLPCDANDFSWAIAEKSLVNDDALMAEVWVFPPAVVPVVFVDDELLHATSPTLAPRHMAARAVRFRETYMSPPVALLWWGGHRRMATHKLYSCRVPYAWRDPRCFNAV